MLVDAQDRVWVQLFPRPLDRREQWLVFEPDGELKARIVMPEGFQFREATLTHAIGVARDQWDVERVERRAIRPAG